MEKVLIMCLLNVFIGIASADIFIVGNPGCGSANSVYQTVSSNNIIKVTNYKYEISNVSVESGYMTESNKLINLNNANGQGNCMKFITKTHRDID